MPTDPTPAEPLVHVGQTGRYPKGSTIWTVVEIFSTRNGGQRVVVQSPRLSKAALTPSEVDSFRWDGDDRA